SDKTGTITQNKMTIREIYFDNKLYSKNFLNEDNILYDIMILNNDVYDNKNEYIGDPTEIALLDFTKKYIDVEKHQERHKRVDELPFDSDRKIMSTINKFGNEYKILSKGSFDSIIDHCSKVLENGEIVKLTETKKRKLKNVEMMESNKSYRVLAFAYKMIEKRYILDNDLENDLIFVGMTSMIDPPREDVKESIMMCKNANIKPIMITGDSLKTACAIAKEIGILENEEEAILGPDLDDLTEEELKEEVKKYTVYARVSPTHKLAIINAWKNNNKVVAMTGDGVNDAPALKQANIGLGMGITGTEVSKNVSDVILSDDSFSTIVAAVKEGRRIFDNIRNVLVFLLTGNIAEVFVVFLAMIFGLEVFVPIQLLYINLITDSLPAIALAFEKEDDNVMKRKARKNDGTFFTPFLISKISLSALFKTICISSIYFISLNYYNNEVASTMAFLTIVMTELVFSFTCRNLKKNIINKNLFNNKYLNISMLILIFIQIIIFVTPIKVLFNICDISLYQALICIVSVMVMFYMDEITKKILVKIFKDE
ncbi:MAG TPA: cation-translocating P-type ATPase, partial [Bacilli bacterium]|nr:cation-translocating P-type ATPase [Bacilli bacterium]